MSRDDDIPSAEAANQAVSVVVTGKRSRVHVTTAQAADGATATATSGPPPTDHGFRTRWRKVGAFVVGFATVAGAVAGVILLATQ